MENLHCEERLKSVRLMRLATNRVRSDLIETFKITNGNYDITPEIIS